MTSCLYKAVQNALISASQRTTRERMRVFSLEERLERGGDVEDPHNWIEEIEVLSNCLSFLGKLQEADRVIMRFRYTHPAVSLALTAQLLREQYPHLRLPKKQSGLTKRLQKLQVLYQQSTMEGA